LPDTRSGGAAARPPRRATTADRPYAGIALMIGFCALAPLGDALAKLLGERVPLLQLLTVRFAAQAAILVPLALLTGRVLRMDRRLMALTFVRTLVHVLALAALFVSLRYLPLADALAIAYVMPFILLLLGRLVLHEDVGRRRIAACGVGFAGTLMVVQPSFAAVGAPALLPLAVAVLFAIFMLVTRHIARDADPISLQAVSGLLGTGLLAIAQIAVPAALTGAAAWVRPAGPDLALLAALGLLGTMAHLVLTWSLRFAPSTTLAPIQYLEIPFATVIGWLIFRDLPNGLAASGIGVIMAAGLYVVARERALARAVPGSA
jgi:drug/metabolite transporter (DMT)-like permease